MTQEKPNVSVLFVCMGNICRSPSAAGVFKQKVIEAGLSQHIQIDSAGTSSFHEGQPADARSLLTSRKRGIDLNEHRARMLTVQDFDAHDYILVMDKQNYKETLQICPPGQEKKVRYFMEYAPEMNTEEVPDPYAGGEDGFEHVLDLLDAASDGFLTYLQFHDLQASF
jgi:protein-tyrosine phosphatase